MSEELTELCGIRKMRNICGRPGLAEYRDLRKTRSDRRPSDIIIYHNLRMVSYITKTGGGRERTKKLEIAWLQCARF